jgi:hypothetical protein
MRLITRIDDVTGDTLIWCGEDFDPMATQASLQESGLTLLEIRDDKWAVVGPVSLLNEENYNGRQEG